jgi:hypothetical protein
MIVYGFTIERPNAPKLPSLRGNMPASDKIAGTPLRPHKSQKSRTRQDGRIKAGALYALMIASAVASNRKCDECELHDSPPGSDLGRPKGEQAADP